MNRLALPLLLALAVFVTASPASAAVGYQANERMTAHDREHLATMAHEARADGWVRVIIDQASYQAQLPYYTQAIATAKAHGSKVMVTLMRWRGLYGTERSGATPAMWQAFTTMVVSRFAGQVDAWSPLNEPNHRAFAAQSSTACQVVASIRRSTSYRTVRGTRRIVRYRRSRSGHWKRRAHWHRYPATRRWVHVRHPHGRGYRRSIRRVKTARTVATVTSTPVRQLSCSPEQNAVAYRRLYDVAAPIIRRLDPSATLVVGDTAGPAAGFVAAAMAARPGRLDADVMGDHYVTKPSDDVAWARRHGWATWSTEFGIAATAAPTLLPAALRTQQEAGVAMTIVYGFWGGDPWQDMGVLDPHGKPRPVFYALRNR